MKDSKPNKLSSICVQVKHGVLNASLLAILLFLIFINIFKHKYVGTPTCHFNSYSISFYLTALLPLSVHQSTHLPSQQQLNHHGKPLFTPNLRIISTITENGPCKRYYLQKATLTSSTNHPKAEQAGKQATGIKVAHSYQRESG